MLQVASGCYDPLGADDRAGGIALPSVFAQAGGGKRHGGKRRRWVIDANDGSRPWDIEGDGDHRIAFGQLSGRVEVGESGRSEQARKMQTPAPKRVQTQQDGKKRFLLHTPLQDLACARLVGVSQCTIAC
jgi:hypothetical protein